MLSVYAKLIVSICLMAFSAYISYAMTDSSWQSKWDSHMLADAEANKKSAEETLATQRELITELEKAQQNAKAMQDTYVRDTAAANDAAGRMRSELDRIKSLPKGNNSTPISVSANAATDRLLLSELLIESDRLAGIYAEQADRNKIAVVQCNNEYNAIRTVINGR